MERGKEPSHKVKEMPPASIEMSETLNQGSDGIILLSQYSRTTVCRTSTRMKSAYELAMERLEKKAPTVSLTNEQKEQIAEIDSSYRAKIAEKELFLKDQIRNARGAGNFEQAESLEKQLSIDVRRLQEDCEEKKEKLRTSFAKSKI